MSEILPGLKRNHVRLSVRILCLLAAVATLWFLVSPWVLSLSPFVAICSVIATRSFPTLAWLGVLVGIVAMAKHRIFCRWVCPMGLCLECASGVGHRLKRRLSRWPSLGRWIVLLTLGGACLGYPLMLWLDPLALFAGGGFLVVVALTVVWPDAWCRRVCPLGASGDLLHAAFTSVRSWVGRQHDVNSNAGLSRRVVLGAAVGAGSARVLGLVPKSDPQPLRPPNARTGTQFSGLCTRCGNCVRACPTGIIERDRGGHGLASLLTPVLSFKKGYCREDCTRCTEVCPSGAILPLRIENKWEARIGRPRVDAELCLLSDDRECSACARWCPYGAIRYVFSETTYSLQVRIDPQKCNGCGACEAACPTRPHKAIVVQPV